MEPVTTLHFTMLDYVIFAVIFLSGCIGLLRGFFREALSLVGWIVAGYLAYRYGALASEWLPQGTPGGPTTRQVLGFLMVFIGTILGVGLLSAVLAMVLESVGLGFTDRTLGLLFGSARGLAIAMIMVVLGEMTALVHEAFWRDSVTRPYVEKAVREVKPWLPVDIAQKITF